MLGQGWQNVKVKDKIKMPHCSELIVVRGMIT